METKRLTEMSLVDTPCMQPVDDPGDEAIAQALKRLYATMRAEAEHHRQAMVLSAKASRDNSQVAKRRAATKAAHKSKVKARRGSK